MAFEESNGSAEALAAIQRFEELGYVVFEDNGWMIEMNNELVHPDDLPTDLQELFYRLEGDGAEPQLRA